MWPERLRSCTWPQLISGQELSSEREAERASHSASPCLAPSFRAEGKTVSSQGPCFQAVLGQWLLLERVWEEIRRKEKQSQKSGVWKSIITTVDIGLECGNALLHGSPMWARRLALCAHVSSVKWGLC